MTRILTAIFSYNRARHLANCLRSVYDLFPEAEVTVYDDNSPDPAVRAAIEDAGVNARFGRGGRGRHGGLYANMQMAFRDAVDGGYDYVLCLQDDMQLVRPFSPAILDEVKTARARFPNVATYEVRFGRGPERSRIVSPDPAPDNAEPAPFRDYLDVGLLDVRRLDALGWSFETDTHLVVSGEQTLSMRASELGVRRARLRTPFAMHLPFPDLFRNRIRLPRLSGLRRRIYRFEYMSDAAMARMDARPRDQIAHWRDYLTVEDTNWFDRWLLSGKNDAKIIA